MRSFTSSARGTTSVLALWLVACGGGKKPIVVGHNDGGDGADLAVPLDLSGPDLAPPPDLASPWHDESYRNSDGGDGIGDMGSLRSVWDDQQGTVLAVGDHGTVLRAQSGGAFALDPSAIPNPANPANLFGVFGSSPSNVFIGGMAGALWKWQGANLTSTSTWLGDAPPTNDYFNGVWVAGDGTAFAAGDTSIVRRVGNMMGTNMSNWTTITGAPSSSEFADGVFGFMTAPGVYSVYVVGCMFDSMFTCRQPRIWHTTGTTLTQEMVLPASTPPCSLVYSIWGSSPSDLYAGCDGTILHSTGDGTWTAQNTIFSLYAAIGGSSASDVYAGGSYDGNGAILVSKHDPASDTWVRERVNVGAVDFYGLSATTSDVYVVGQLGTILHK